MALTWTLSSLPELQHLSNEERSTILSSSIDWIVHTKMAALPLISGLVPLAGAVTLFYNSMYPLLAIGFVLIGVLCTLAMRLLLISRCRDGLRIYLREMQTQGIFISCLECSFDLRGSSTGICPECGNEPSIDSEDCSDDLRAPGRSRQRPLENETLYQTLISYCRGHFNLSKHPRTYRFVYGAVLILAILLLVISVIIEINQSELSMKRMSHNDGTYAWGVEWGENKGTLEFVLFEGYPNSSPNKSTGLITFVSDVNEGNHAWLNKPDGTQLRFPSTFMLIEYVDGEYRESKEQVSLESLESYLATKPTKYTIDGLLSHAKKKP